MADALDALWSDVLKTEQLHGAIRTKATDLGIDPALALSLAHQESRFDPSATSPTGVQGLFQVTKATGQQYGQAPGQRTNPDQSMHAGLSYFKDLLTESNGNVAQALTRYNGGSDPRFAANVLSHYPLHAARQQAPEDPIDALAREIGLTKPTPAPADSDFPMETQVIPNQDPTQPALLAPPGAAVGQGTGGYQMTIDIAKPSEGNEAETGVDASGRRVRPENLEADLSRELAPSALPWRQAAAMGISAVGAGGGALLGGIAGTALGGPAGGVAGTIGGEIAGSFGSHKINQALGLEPGKATAFDPTLWPPSGDVLALAGPPALRGAGAISTQIVKRLPGAPAALHEEAVKSLEGLPGRFAPARPSAEYYAELAAGTNPAIPSVNLATQASDLLRREMALQPSMRSKPIVQIAQDFQDLYRQYRGQIPIEQLYDHQQRLGLLVREADRMAWPQATGLKRMYGAIHGDIDEAIAKGIPEAAKLRQATTAARREFAQDDLTALIAPGSPGVTTRPDGLVQVNGGRLMDRFNRKIMTDKTFADTFSPAERKEIQDLFHEMQRLPRIPPSSGQTFGSGGVIQRGGLTYLMVSALTHDPALAAGAATAYASVPPLIAKAMMTAPGRALLRRYLNAGQVIGPAELAALRTVTTMGLGEEGAGTTAPVPTPVAPLSAPVPGLLGPGRVPMPGIQR